MTTIAVDEADLRALFDLAINSLDFGSGFWENTDVEVARRIATLINVDPIVATPPQFTKQYPHLFHPYETFKREPDGTETPIVICWYCPLEQTANVHLAPAPHDTDSKDPGSRG